MNNKKSTLDVIRRQIEDNIGKKVLLRTDQGRKRIVMKEGILTSAYPDIFTVRFENEYQVERTISFSYSDVLTSTVTLRLCA